MINATCAAGARRYAPLALSSAMAVDSELLTGFVLVVFAAMRYVQAGLWISGKDGWQDSSGEKSDLQGLA